MTPPGVGTYWRTVRHLRWGQLAALARRRLLRHLTTARSAFSSSIEEGTKGGRLQPVALRKISPALAFPEWQPAVALKMLETGECCFLNVTHPPSGYIPWSSEGFSRLWLYHLNYCDFLNVDLRAPRHRFHLRKALGLARDWCTQNLTGREIGWEPYPLSLRIVNWLKFLIRNAERAETLGEAQTLGILLASLRVQTLALEAQLEKDLLANHLIKNIKALMLAGALLEAPESARWLRKGEELLRRELGEQVLLDGGHFERSPMYHAAVLEDLLDLQTLTKACGIAAGLVPMLSECVNRMASFLRTILHPDEDIPLLNDSALNLARPARELLTMAGHSTEISSDSFLEVTVLAETGYAVIRDPDSQSCMIFDCGPLGPDYQPGHGHCDVLSYELSLHGQRVVVDTGVSTYEPGSERHYERSTAAHNTIRVDGEEQAEIWASFRVGRRPRVGQIRSGGTEGLRWLRGEHHGYYRQGATHERLIIEAPNGCWLVVDSLGGTGRHRIESFVHFHPGVGVKPQRGGNVPVGEWSKQALIDVGGRPYFVVTIGDGSVAFEDSYYAPEFGRRLPQKVLYWTWKESLPARMVLAFVPAISDQALPTVCFADKAVEINGWAVPLQ